MTSLAKYWIFVSLNSAGGYRKREVAQAKLFIQQQFSQKPDLPGMEIEDAPENLIQQQLFSLYQTANTLDLSQQQFLAKLCLRCCISHQILHVCMQLATQFGQTYGFNYNDLLPYVLNDVLSAGTTFVSLADEVLSTFDPQRSNLGTWTSRKVKHHRLLNDFLLEYGVYLISDWAILNDTKPKQLERILREFHHLAAMEVQQLTLLLQSYHQVYRADRLNQRPLRRNQPCPLPSETQLHRIAQGLPTPQLPSHRLLRQLQDLAELVRSYRIHVRGGNRSQESLDHPDHSTFLESLTTPQLSEDEAEQTEFLLAFRQAFTTTLEQAIVQVTQTRLNQLQTKSPKEALKFFTALELFHCQGQAMGTIASQVGLQQQYQVSRLLALKQFRDAVRRHMLVSLGDTCLKQTDIYLNPERLHALDAALEELITDVFHEAAAEVSHTKGTPLRSRFAHSLCQYLCQIEAGISNAVSEI